MARSYKKDPGGGDNQPPVPGQRRRYSALTGRPVFNRDEYMAHRFQQAMEEDPELKQAVENAASAAENSENQTDRPVMPSRPAARPAMPSRPEARPTVPSRPEARPPMPSRPEARPTVPSRPETRPVIPSRPEARPDPGMEQLLRNMQQQLRSKDVELKQRNSEIAALKNQVEELKQLAQNDREEEVRELLMQVQEEKRKMETAYNSLKGRIDGAYSADDLAVYFGRAIDTFNDRMNDEDDHMPSGELQGSVGYIINGMDVDLKAQIVKNEKTDELIFLSDPERGGPDALSTVKISIKAFPKGVPGKGGR